MSKPKLTYGQALRLMAERVPYASESQRADVLDAIDAQHAPRPKPAAKDPEKGDGGTP